MNYRQAVGLSWEVRKKCWDFAQSDKSARYDFHKHADLECMCAVASMALRKASGGAFDVIMGKYVDGKMKHSHCWAEYGDWVFDLTASQFGVHIPVLILRHDNAIKRYLGRQVTNRYCDFNWGHTQNPSPSLIGVILDGKV